MTAGASPFPPPLEPGEIDALFPLERPPIKDGVFEIGLVLGGTISAGAYTGGVLDYLMEALDAWTRAKEEGSPEAPPHEVVISTIAGASGGAINGAIFTRAAGWSFPHGAGAQNPFHSAWVGGVDLRALLSVEPEPGVTGFASAFNCSPIDKQAKRTMSFEGAPLGVDGSPRHRSYLADPLRLMVMVGNLTGIPYSLSLSGDSKLTHDLRAHADMIRFAFGVDGGVPVTPQMRKDELALSSTSPLSWDRLGAAAMATSAFPLAFRARGLERALEVCGYRVVVVPGGKGEAPSVVQLRPRWDVLAPGDPIPAAVKFANVDGGTMNNEPLDVVRTALAGLNGRNERSGRLADRAVLLVDPFSDPETLGPDAPPDVAKLVMPFIMSLVFQARFKPADIALAYAPDVYSRFLIAPVGPGPGGPERKHGSKAIASGGLGGFLGFLDQRFLDYDYRLGRRNAYEFLHDWFFFPKDNPVFTKHPWTPEQIARYARASDGQLPMIPLMPSLAEPPKMSGADWPRVDDLPSWLSDAVEKRLDFVYDEVMQAVRPDGWFARAFLSSTLGSLWSLGIRGKLRDYMLKTFGDGLDSQKLRKQ